MTHSDVLDINLLLVLCVAVLVELEADAAFLAFWAVGVGLVDLGGLG